MASRIYRTILIVSFASQGTLLENQDFEEKFLSWMNKALLENRGNKKTQAQVDLNLNGARLKKNEEKDFGMY